MPAKLDECVKKLVAEGKSQESAWAICTAALKASDKGILIGDLKPFKAVLDKGTGFLTAPVKLARTGVQTYFGFELGLVDRALDKIGVYRPAEEVFHPDSIASFTNLVITDDHPSEMVTVDNVKELQKGTVSEVKSIPEENVLDGIATITDKKQIKKIQDGKKEVSVGYGYDLVSKKGTYNGEDYEFIQTNIRANHLAIVDAGRCGSACKIMDNKTKETKVKITINGIDYDVEDTALAQAIQNQQSAYDADQEKMKKKMEDLEEENMELKKKADKAEAAKDAAEKLVLDDDSINKLVSDRASLLAQAKDILGDKMPECNDCPKEIKAAVVDSVLDLGDLSGKSADYIDAAYDMAIEQHKKAKDSIQKLGNDFKEKQTGKDGPKSREEARSNYMKDQLKIVD